LPSTPAATDVVDQAELGFPIVVIGLSDPAETGHSSMKDRRLRHRRLFGSWAAIGGPELP
jgi:hypothetical protein